MVREYKPKKILVWTDEKEDSFNKVCSAINNCSKLFFINNLYKIVLETDASKYGIGAYLYQEKNDGTTVPISLISKAFTKQ